MTLPALHLTRYSPCDDPHAAARAFYDDVIDVLMQHETENNLLIGLCGAARMALTFSVVPYLAVVRRPDAEIAAVGVRVGGFLIVLSHGADPAALPLLIDDLYAMYGATLKGINAEVVLAAAFSAAWTERSGQSVHSVLKERLYRLDVVIPVSGAPGELRHYTPADRDLAAGWILAFEHETGVGMMGGMQYDETVAMIDRRTGGDPRVAGLCFWWHNGEAVAMAGHAGPTPHSVRVNAVYTPPHQRGHGYASALVAALSRHLLESGYAWTTLFTDLANPTSNKIYQAIGYRPVTDIDMIRFTPQG